MHSCERSDHFVKPSRDLESLGHYGAYETETAGVGAVKNKYETQWQNPLGNFLSKMGSPGVPLKHFF